MYELASEYWTVLSSSFLTSSGHSSGNRVFFVLAFALGSHFPIPFFQIRADPTFDVTMVFGLFCSMGFFLYHFFQLFFLLNFFDVPVSAGVLSVCLYLPSCPSITVQMYFSKRNITIFVQPD